MNKDLQKLQAYCETWKIHINIQKTVLTLFFISTYSPSVSKKWLQLQIGEKRFKSDEHPKCIGVTLDQNLTMKQ